MGTQTHWYDLQQYQVTLQKAHGGGQEGPAGRISRRAEVGAALLENGKSLVSPAFPVYAWECDNHDNRHGQ